MLGNSLAIMKLGISLLNLIPSELGGLETYIKELIKHASSLFPDDEIIYFVYKDIADYLPKKETKIVVDYTLKQVTRLRILEAVSLKRAKKIELAIKDSGVEGMLYTQMSMFPLHNPVPTVLLMADVRFLTGPCKPCLKVMIFRKLCHVASMRKATRIISVSELTKKSIIKHLHIAPDKITVIHHGYDKTANRIDHSENPIQASYLYYPSSTTPYKGHITLIQTFSKLKKNHNISKKLIFTGLVLRDWENEILPVIQEEKLEDDILQLGYVSRKKVEQLYQHADAILFPTEFEGFGIPTLEAVSYGKKLITSRFPIFDELGVPERWQIDFSDPNQLLHALKQDGPTKLEKKPISWKESIRRNIEVLKDTANTGI